jgi:hypothetical protein
MMAAMTAWTADQLKRKADVEAGRTVIANMRKGGDEALIAWAKATGRFQRVDRRSDWGNPFAIGKDGNRDQVIAKFHALWGKRPATALKGRVLGCWCYPQACHAQVLAEAANAK